jgi:hypothetical protein
MLRFTSLLMMFLFAAPAIEDCSLLMTDTPPCHELNQSDDPLCFASHQAIAETKLVAAMKSPMETSFCVVADRAPLFFTEITCIAQKTTYALLPGDSIYLQDRALLI